MPTSSTSGSSHISPTEHLELAAQLVARFIDHERGLLREAQQDYRLSMSERSSQKIALLELALNLILDEVPPKPSPQLPPFVTALQKIDG